MVIFCHFDALLPVSLPYIIILKKLKAKMVSRPGFWSLRRKRKSATKNKTEAPVQSGAAWKSDIDGNDEYSEPKTSQESYILALERKLAEATGIKINQVKFFNQ